MTDLSLARHIGAILARAGEDADPAETAEWCEALFHRQVAREGRLVLERDRVDVRRHQRWLPVQAAAARVGEEGVEDEARPLRAVRGGERVEGFAPLGGFGGIGVRAAAGENRADVSGEREVGHASILRGRTSLAEAASNRRRGFTAART